MDGRVLVRMNVLVIDLTLDQADGVLVNTRPFTKQTNGLDLVSLTFHSPQKANLYIILPENNFFLI